ncbi:MAG TPA: bifunctional transaldolase/phosoglucose isomerase [Rhizomicrobium sp.]|jgi:transaldolase/glucose-6-phosphate isomerase
MNKVRQLETFGQSVWLDFLSREFLASDEFRALITEDGLKGMTSNPSIFEKAIGHGKEYDDAIRRSANAGMGVGAIFRQLSVADIRTATDALRPVYDATHGADGFVSIEVSPYLAYDSDASIAEARSLWREIDRPNLMVKIPGTSEGIPAIRQLLSEGININITLLFAEKRYEEVAEAYLSALETLSRAGRLDRIASVASFFVSRIDSKVDAALDTAIAKASGDTRATLEALKGKVAIANAKLAYAHYKKTFSGQRWQQLLALGAHPQRLLWASTSTKNKAYPDVLYVDALIGRDTVNTIPLETLNAFRDHGHPAATLDNGVDEAKAQLDRLAQAGISLDAITDTLVTEGVDLFAAAADQLYATLADKRAKFLDGRSLRLAPALGDAQKAVDAEIAQWTRQGKLRRLWAHDNSVWTGADEQNWLGWLDIANREAADLSALDAFAKDVRDGGFEHIVLLGMGGSSLGAEVIGLTLAGAKGQPTLHVLDSTDPDQIHTVERSVSPGKTLFLVSSKSGTTLEPNILMDHFLRFAATGGGDAAKQFVAITDPGTPFEKVAREKGFRHIFHGDPAIGGRFSVLSKFGLVPAAATGVDVKRLLSEAMLAAESCEPMAPPASNPGVQLGVALGVLARDFKRDKITFVCSRSIASLGAWLEQLLAESTGKHGKGLIPLDGESLGEVDVYGDDRVFVHLHVTGDNDANTQLKALQDAGHPVIRLVIEDTYQIAQMFFVWEMAVAVAGSVIGINPFDQPDVEASKVRTRELTDQMEGDGKSPSAQPDLECDGFALYADDAGKSAIAGAQSLTEALRLHVNRAGKGDYFALLAYVERSEAHARLLEAVRLKLRDSKHVATCLGFGPRYLHSTGQAYKGGPNSGVFLTITGDHANDVALENRKLTFGAVEVAQAMGDFDVLKQRGRRALRVHLTKDIQSGLAALADALGQALT